ncbi:TPA: ead/Ea22-like family protein [Escherichia coli]
MSKINYQELREAAEKATKGKWAVEFDDEIYSTDGIKHEQIAMVFSENESRDAEFIAAANPATVLALLDERERNQQYIKRRDQENEEIALTVGKLRVELEAANKRIAELEAEPVSQAYNLAELIEGMEVSIDVSTCDADLGNRYFGTVTEALELDTAKNGYILLVQDAEPNFDVNGSSPVTPDGWISCSERMPEETGDIIVVSDGIVMSGISYSRRDGFYIAALEYDDDEPIDGVTHWMPLPEAPQEVK